jgi:hypothetical protein
VRRTASRSTTKLRSDVCGGGERRKGGSRAHSAGDRREASRGRARRKRGDNSRWLRS